MKCPLMFPITSILSKYEGDNSDENSDGSNSEGDSGDNNPGNQEGSDKPGEEGLT